MFQKRTQTAPRLLTPEDPDVPAAFAVFENDDLYYGLDAVRDAFANPQTRLVVWHKPPFFGGPQPENIDEETVLKDSVQALRARVCSSFAVKSRLQNSWRGFFSPDYDYIDTGVREHFYDIARNANLSDADCAIWREETLNLVDALEECFASEKIKLTTKFQRAAQHDFRGAYMLDYLRSNSLRAVRTASGDSLRFYDESDVTRRAYQKGLRMARVKDGAQAWSVRPWDIAFISQNTVFENPVTDSGDSPRRVMQIFDIKARTEFIASAQRPLLRPVIRPWLKRLLNGPADF